MSEYTLPEVWWALVNGHGFVDSSSKVAKGIDAAIAREAELRAENERLSVEANRRISNAESAAMDWMQKAEKAEQRIAELEAAGAQSEPSIPVSKLRELVKEWNDEVSLNRYDEDYPQFWRAQKRCAEMLESLSLRTQRRR